MSSERIFIRNSGRARKKTVSFIIKSCFFKRDMLAVLDQKHLKMTETSVTHF